MLKSDQQPSTEPKPQPNIDQFLYLSHKKQYNHLVMLQFRADSSSYRKCAIANLLRFYKKVLTFLLIDSAAQYGQ